MLSSLLWGSHSLFQLIRQDWTTVVGLLFSLLSGSHSLFPLKRQDCATARRLHSYFLLPLKRQDWTTVMGLLFSLLLGHTVTLYSHSRGRTKLLSWEHFMLPFLMYTPLPAQESLLLGPTVTLYSHSRGRTELLLWDHFMLPFCMYAISITRQEETICSHILCNK